MIAMLLSLMLATADPAGAIVGRWQGQSICVKIESNRFCHDEDVQYTFTRSGENFHQYAEKKVDGQYAPMGELDFTYDAATRTWSAPFQGKRSSGVWSYTIEGEVMKGTCVVLPDKLVVRNVLVHRVP